MVIPPPIALPFLVPDKDKPQEADDINAWATNVLAVLTALKLASEALNKVVDLTQANGAGALLKFPKPSGAPATTATPAGWLPVTVNGVAAFVPYYV
jgi:hypothetical protein